jgi:hypothetical protein
VERSSGAADTCGDGEKTTVAFGLRMMQKGGKPSSARGKKNGEGGCTAEASS